MIRNNPMHDTKNPPGQYRDKTLGDIIDRVRRSEARSIPTKKLTFDDWWHQNNDDSLCYECARRAWEAGQANV